MVRKSYLIWFIAYLAASPVQPTAAQGQSGLEGVEAANFGTLFNAEAARRHSGTTLIEQPCEEADAEICAHEDPRIRSFDFATASLTTVSARGGTFLNTLIWNCGRECKPDDFLRGITLCLNVLASDQTSHEIAAQLSGARAAMTEGWFWTGQIGRVRIDVVSDKAFPNINATFTSVDAEATNKKIETRHVVKAMHASERALALSIRLVDSVEIKKQSYALYNLMPNLKEDIEFLQNSSCGLALSDLAVMARDLVDTNLSPAQKHSSFTARRWSYIKSALSCERATRTSPPTLPNLR